MSTERKMSTETKQKKSSNFLVQGSILAMASIISRLIGLVYRIPMTAIIGDVGNNYYASAYDVYNVMLIISSYSLPLAVSKLVSARVAKGEKRMACRIFWGSLLFALVSGSIVALVVWFGADFFTASLLKTPLSIFALKVLAPALVVVAVLGVIRGFFQGLGTMVPSAVSQIIEQIVNAIVSIWAAYMLYQYGTKVGAVLGDPDGYAAAYGAAGGTLGTNLGSCAALLFMILVFAFFLRRFKADMREEDQSPMDSFGYVMITLITTIIPVLLSTTIYNISGIIDQSIFKNVALLQGYQEDQVDVWWGVYTGKYKLMINVPISIASALAASSVPSLTHSFAGHDMEQVRKKIGAAMRFVMVIAMPCAVGLGVLARPIFILLFPSTIATIDLSTHMMWAGCAAVVFYAMSTLSNGLLQGINRLRIPVRNAAIALVLHLFVLLILMMGFRLNIYAVVYANAFFALLMCLLNSAAVAKYSGFHQEFLRTFLIPAFCSGIMGVCAFFVYKGAYSLCGINSLAFLLAFLAAVAVYFVSLMLFKGLNEEEIRMFPMGGKLAGLAKKLHLLK